MEDEPRTLEPTDPLKCGQGTGPACCIYLAMGPPGWVCAQQSSLRPLILQQKPHMRAQRQPEGSYPGCQEEGR